MLSQSLRRAVNHVSKTFFTSQRDYSSSNRNFYYLASMMTKDLQNSIPGRFSPSNFFKRSPSMFYKPTRSYYQTLYSTYEQKTITSDQNGRVVVKTQRKVPGRPWETHVEEYVDDHIIGQNKKPESIGQSQASNAASKPNETEKAHNTSQQQTTGEPISQSDGTTKTSTPTTQNTKDQTTSTQTSSTQWTDYADEYPLSIFDRHFQQLSNSMMRDFEHFFDIDHPFSTSYKWFEPEIDKLDIESSTTYHSRTVTNNNGLVTVKTTTKRPGGKWETCVKQYSKDSELEDDQKKSEAIDDTNKKEQMTA